MIIFQGWAVQRDCYQSPVAILTDGIWTIGNMWGIHFNLVKAWELWELLLLVFIITWSFCREQLNTRTSNRKSLTTVFHLLVFVFHDGGYPSHFVLSCLEDAWSSHIEFWTTLVRNLCVGYLSSKVRIPLKGRHLLVSGKKYGTWMCQWLQLTNTYSTKIHTSQGSSGRKLLETGLGVKIAFGTRGAFTKLMHLKNKHRFCSGTIKLERTQPTWYKSTTNRCHVVKAPSLWIRSSHWWENFIDEKNII